MQMETPKDNGLQRGGFKIRAKRSVWFSIGWCVNSMSLTNLVRNSLPIILYLEKKYQLIFNPYHASRVYITE